MHAAPTDFTFGRQPFPEALGNVASFGKSPGNALLVAIRVLSPIGRATSRIDTHNAVGPHAEIAEGLGDMTGFADLGDEVLAVMLTAHGRTTTVGCHTGATTEPTTKHLAATLSARRF